MRTLHILINDEGGFAETELQLFSIFDVLKLPFIQVKNSAQFEELIEHLANNISLFIWVHPNASQRKDKGMTTPGEVAANYLYSKKGIDFEVVSRYPDDVNQKLLSKLKKSVVDCNDIMSIIENKVPQSVLTIKKCLDIHSKSHDSSDFAIITALYDDECTTFLDNMDYTPSQYFKNGYSGKHVKLQENIDYKGDFLVINQDKMGVIDAASFATKIITEHNPKFLLMGGVCGGRKNKDVNLYDVIIPKKIFDYMTGKMEKGTFISYNHSASANHNLVTFLEKQVYNIKARMLNLSRNDMKGIVEKVTIHFGDFACGPWVVKTNDFMEEELAIEEKKDILGLEMESISILRTSENFQEYGKYSIVVKSVMDFTDDKKSDGLNGAIKTTAAYISYLCIRAIMPILMEFKDTNNPN